MRKIFLISIITIMMGSCNDKKPNVVGGNYKQFNKNSFKDSLFVKSIKLIEVSDSVFRPSKMIITEKYLILNENKTDVAFHVMSIPEDKYIGKFGAKGKGPGEVLVPWRFTITDKGLLGLLDPKQKKVVLYHLDTLQNHNKFESEYTLDSSIEFNSIAIEENTIYYVDSHKTKEQLYSSSFNGSNVKGYGETLIKYESSKNKKQIIPWGRSLMVKNDNIFAFSFYFSPLLRIYNIDTDIWVDILGPEEDFELFGNGRRKAYADIRITDRYIYALYKGEEENGSDIYVFSHKGEFIKRIILDKGVFTFDVDKDQFIYGINIDLNYSVLKFNIQ